MTQLTNARILEVPHKKRKMPKDYKSLLAAMDFQEFLDMFLEDNWDLIAANAWDGYLKEERGVLLIFLMDTLNNPFGNCKYVGQKNQENGGLTQLLKQWDNPNVNSEINLYDPHTHVVITFVLPEARPNTTLNSTDFGNTPPDAYYRLVESGKYTSNLLPPD